MTLKTLFLILVCLTMGGSCLAQPGPTADILPLARGRQWIYNFASMYVSAGNYRMEHGWVTYLVTGKLATADSLTWHLIRDCFIADSTFGRYGVSTSMNRDTVEFDLVERTSGNHEVYRLQSDSADLFPFQRAQADSERFCRYAAVDQIGKAQFALNLSSHLPWYQRFFYSFTATGDTGISYLGCRLTLEWNRYLYRDYTFSGLSITPFMGAKLFYPSTFAFTTAAGVPRDTSLVVTNEGIDTLTVVAVSSSDSSLVASIVPANIPPHHRGILALRYLSSSVQTTSVKVVIRSNSLSAPDTIPVTIRNRPLTLLSLSQRNFAFGDLDVISRNFDIAFDVANLGPRPLYVDSSKTSDGEFSLIRAVEPIAPGQVATWRIRFTPGPPFHYWRKAKIIVFTNSLSSPDTLSAFVDNTHGAQFIFSPLKIDFGEVSIGSSDSSAIHITYQGDASINLYRFGPADTTSAFVMPNQISNNCYFCAPVRDRVVFKPVEVGKRTSYVTYVSKLGSDWGIDTVWLQGTGVIDTTNGQGKVVEFALQQNYPNPFNPSTMIRFGLPNRAHVILTVFNALGQQVAELVNGDIESGYHEARFDGSGLSSGVYFYRLQTGTFVQTRKLILLK